MTGGACGASTFAARAGGDAGAPAGGVRVEAQASPNSAGLANHSLRREALIMDATRAHAPVLGQGSLAADALRGRSALQVLAQEDHHPRSGMVVVSSEIVPDAGQGGRRAAH